MALKISVYKWFETSAKWLHIQVFTYIAKNEPAVSKWFIAANRYVLKIKASHVNGLEKSPGAYTR